METIKEEKKADLEQLLNSLVSKGWKPFRESRINEINRAEQYAWNWNWCCWGIKDAIQRRKSTRELVSKESWLWQFCIANHLLKKYSDLWDDDEYIIWRWQNWMDWKTTDWEYIDENYDSDIYHQDDSYQYRIIESSLKDESELEDFLLTNIVIEDE